MVFSFVFNSLVWFWLLWIFKLEVNLLIIGYFVVCLLTTFILKRYSLIGDIEKSGGKLLSAIFIIICIYLLAMSFGVYLPLIKTISQENYTFYRFPGVWDALKHLYAVTAIKETGLPPAHPYFPQANFSYYYGYYILPAATSLISGIDFKVVYLLHYLISVLVCLLLVFDLVRIWIKEKLGRVIALFLTTIGFGWDIIPTIMVPKESSVMHIEVWMCGIKNLLQITTFPTALIWVPQHLLASLISILIITRLLKGQKSVFEMLFLVLLSAYVFLSSVFVGMSLAIFLFFVFIRELLAREACLLLIKRYAVFGLGIITLLYPYLLSLLSQRGNLLTHKLVYPQQSLPGLPNFPPLNLFLDLFFEFGGAIFLFSFVGLGLVWRKRTFWFHLLPIALILFLVHFIVSPTTNDFGMRTLMPSQIIISIFAGWSMGKVIERLKSRKFWLILSVVFLSFSLGLSLIGQIYEVLGRWKERKVLHWEESQLIGWVINKTKPREKLASLESNEGARTIEMIPPVAGRVVYSMSPYSAAVYLIKEDEIKLEKTKQPQLKAIINGEADFYYDDFLELSQEWLSVSRPDYLIFRNQIWVEEDKNPFLEIYKTIFPQAYESIGNHTVFFLKKMDLAQINKAWAETKPLMRKTILPGEEKISLQKGFYLFDICFDNPTDSRRDLVIEIERFYNLVVLPVKAAERRCVKRLFFSPDRREYNFKIKADQKTKVFLEAKLLLLN
jgi:hypothetical protein